jgi:hypothetical protein
VSWQFALVWRHHVASSLTASEVRCVLSNLADLTLCRSIQLLVRPCCIWSVRGMLKRRR